MPFAQAAYLFAPLLAATAVSAIVLKYDAWSSLRRPIDGGRSWRGHPIFGASKTWRGVVVAMTGCTLGVAIQIAIGPRAGALALLDYRDPTVLALGPLMGLGATLGELPNSFAKRRLGIAPGKTSSGPLRVVFYVCDQIDLVIGAWPFVALWVFPRVDLVLASAALVFALHPIVSLIGYAIGARRTAR